MLKCRYPTVPSAGRRWAPRGGERTEDVLALALTSSTNGPFAARLCGFRNNGAVPGGVKRVRTVADLRQAEGRLIRYNQAKGIICATPALVLTAVVAVVHPSAWTLGSAIVAAASLAGAIWRTRSRPTSGPDMYAPDGSHRTLIDDGGFACGPLATLWAISSLAIVGDCAKAWARS